MKNPASLLQNDPFALARELMLIPSVSGREQALIRFVDDLARSWGFVTEHIPVDTQGRSNLLLRQSVPPHVLLSTHLDVVPGGKAPHDDGTFLYGRGSCDAKGIAAAMLCALHDLKQAAIEHVGLLLVVGEETHSDGAKAAAQQLDPVELLVNGEPTQLRFVRAQRGALAFDLSARGESCHSGYPELGHSALHTLLDVLQKIRDFKWPDDPVLGQSLVNIGFIAGGRAANVLADQAQAQVMMRLARPLDEIKTLLAALIPQDVDMQIRTESDPQFLWLPEGQQDCVAGFASDIAHLRPIARKMAMIGPGRIHDAHSEHECVAIADLDKARRLYFDLCQQFIT